MRPAPTWNASLETFANSTRWDTFLRILHEMEPGARSVSKLYRRRAYRQPPSSTRITGTDITGRATATKRISHKKAQNLVCFLWLYFCQNFGTVWSNGDGVL